MYADIRFPQSLTALPNWVCWRLEPDKKSGRDVKVPYNPATGFKASIVDKTTWGTLDAAFESQARYMFSGIGFVFTDDSDINAIDTSTNV